MIFRPAMYTTCRRNSVGRAANTSASSEMPGKNRTFISAKSSFPS